ncbi:oligopeptide/dipeptide ABC transporter ATP-binding protein [Devosia neptuniae]|jgi:oligopeptide/dipeptide ABC transporter ATP-binding protein|uniref:ABC transporter ATP-binding protein n=1 Tax=Devosia TaxID=46913 RepID=UPI0022B07E74|nr:oligopeptide/dipeptide ABC transporter ATP-binding protein [Devosia neptuniae]MCZ4344413.1 ATP-binding cassette domain-containing protein [Devosia neptuniae]|tara:strand:- start:2091 stop:3065 length:975 start_codon:yes stop_codon:yes gene_type:complete
MQPDGTPLLSVDNLEVHFPIRAGVLQRQVGAVKAVDGVSFTLGRGETLSLVGESGCGKSTTGLALMGLVKPTGGRVNFDGQEIRSFNSSALKAYRRRMQIVFQDPFSSLNPRQRVRDIIRAPLDIHAIGTKTDRRARVAELMERVGLRPDQAENFPHQFSGGQRQRIGIARALAFSPDVIVCDEPVSALDVSVQAQILNLLGDLQRDLGVSYLAVSHDLGVVEYISHRVAVMYLGRIVEIAPKTDIFANPTHPYTELLMRSAPSHDPRQRHQFSATSDDIPSATRKPSGCPFHTRCPLASDTCKRVDPELTARADGRLVACHNK